MLLALFLTTFSLDDFCNQRIIYDTIVTCPCILDPWRAHLLSIFFCFTHLSKVSRFIDVVTLKFSQEAHLDKIWQPLTPRNWLCVFVHVTHRKLILGYFSETDELRYWSTSSLKFQNFKSQMVKISVHCMSNFLETKSSFWPGNSNQ